MRVLRIPEPLLLSGGVCTAIKWKGPRLDAPSDTSRVCTDKNALIEEMFYRCRKRASIV